MNLFNKNFKTAFLFIFLAELLSLWGYFLPDFNNIAFFVIAGLTLVLSLQKLEYGIYIVLAELFIGSKGYLFFFEHSGLVISIRIALWLIVMAVWAGKVIGGWAKTKKLKIEFFRSSYFSYFLIFFIFIIWGAVNGILNNELSDVFFDFNNWLYFLLAFPLYSVILERSPAPREGRDEVIESHEKPASANDEILSRSLSSTRIRGSRVIINILQIFTAAIIWLCAKTFFLLFIFSHFSAEAVYDIYRWVRVSGVGEITNMQSGFDRIFFQSHIFALIGFFVFLVLAINQIQNYKSKKFYLLFAVSSLLLSAVIITFSRSFWVGLALGLFAVCYLLLIYQKAGWKKIFQVSGMLMACAIASFILIFAIVKFPYPSSTADFSTSLLSERASDISEGAAVSSRWNLLPELWAEIKNAPILGKGFGATVTYISGDPRVLEASLTGEYTTYAFEWGWLDIWLKMGLFGALAYLILIGKVIYGGVKLGIGGWESGDLENKIILGLTVGLAVVAVVSVFSPYMNHPLGIGYLVLASVALENLREKKEGS